MTKIDIFSGFLGAGKTTLIKKLIQESFGGQKVVLIENEFGEIGIDGGFLQESGIQINELNAGCICCSLVGDFREALKKVVAEYHPDRILIEPSGVGKLSDVTRAVEGVAETLDVELSSFVTVADVNILYGKNPEKILEVISGFDQIVTVEDHNVNGGLGAYISRLVCEHEPKKVTRIGLSTFGESGPAKELADYYGFSPENISNTVKDGLK